MSWHYLPELAEEYLVEFCRDSQPFALWKLSNIAERSCYSVSGMVSFHSFLYGTTSAHSTASNGVALWMLSLRVSRVSHSASPGSRKPTWMKETCGRQPFASLAKSDLNGAYWRMSQACLPGMDTSEKYSGAWPKSGILAGGAVYQLPPLERRIKGKGYGLWRTPNAWCGRRGPKSKELYEECLRTGKHAVNLEDQVKHLWPTPAAQSRGVAGSGNSAKLEMMLYPTPKRQNANSPGLHGQGGMDLQTFVAVEYPIPTKRDYKDTGNSIANGTVPVNGLLGRAVCPTKKNGSLNPGFVEYLMGYPEGWTDLKPVGMDRFLQWQEQHGRFLAIEED